jgi:hypothetical protein
MADEPKTPDSDDELLLDQEVEQPGPDDEDEGDEEEIPTFGDTVEEEKDTDNATVRHMRQVTKEALKRAAEAERRAAEAEAKAKPQAVEVGPKPTLWDEGIDNDEDKYDAAMEEWRARKAAAERQSTVQVETAEEQKRAWENRLVSVAQEKVALAKPDADEAFETVKAALGEAKFAGVIGIVDEGNAAKMIYALAKNPDQLAAVAAQSDPIRLVKDIAKLEGQLKMVKRRKPIEPDTPERGSARISRTTGDKKLAKLEEEAERTGDRTKLVQYKRDLKTAK